MTAFFSFIYGSSSSSTQHITIITFPSNNFLKRKTTTTKNEIIYIASFSSCSMLIYSNYICSIERNLNKKFS
jgi:hypothetical protein